MKGLTLNWDWNSSVSLLNNILSAYAQQAATKIQTPRKRNIIAVFYKNSKKCRQLTRKQSNKSVKAAINNISEFLSSPETQADSRVSPTSKYWHI